MESLDLIDMYKLILLRQEELNPKYGRKYIANIVYDDGIGINPNFPKKKSQTDGKHKKINFIRKDKKNEVE